MNQQERRAKLKLSWFRHFQEKSQNIAKTCRYFGISRPTYYFWRQKYQKNGIAGLYERSRRPQNSPGATNPEIIRKILNLRKDLKSGPIRISHYLAAQHIKISPKTAYLILKKHNLNKKSKLK